tara:strand:- start:308 stop:535 length:228 start_codon:yes stop_codon:yes gene_type:complete
MKNDVLHSRLNSAGPSRERFENDNLLETPPTGLAQKTDEEFHRLSARLNLELHLMMNAMLLYEKIIKSETSTPYK